MNETNEAEQMRVINPAAYFFHQSQNTTAEYREKINEFIKKLVNLEQCIMCKKSYNIMERTPRILIHCGHTLCQSCLRYFHKNFRVRCPLCLKLIKNIDTIERLPVNHTIYTKLVEDEIHKNKHNEAAIENLTRIVASNRNGVLPMPGPIKVPYGEQQQQQDAQGEAADIPDLDYCEYHTDRVKHFYCMGHKTLCCRVCGEIMHNKANCTLIDLYEIDDIEGFLNEIQSKDIVETVGQDEDADLQLDVENGDDEDEEEEDELSNKSI